MKEHLFSPTFKPALAYGLIYFVLLLGALSCQTTAYADPAIRHYNIPAGPMANAVNQLAETGGIQAIYDTQVTQGRVSKGLQGSYSTEAALQKLLSGTGLVYTLSDGTVNIRAEKNPIIPVANPTLNEPSSETTLPKVTVEADAESDPYDPVDTSNPYNKSYSATNASTATKTDTPIMETPTSIQVVPRAVADDQQAIRLQDITKNVSGVQQTSGFGDFYDQFIMRGFDSGTDIYRLRNGARVPNMTFEPANLDRVEVLKGPASILYGRIEPGGLINAVTRKPLSEPYYALSQQFGSYDLYRTTLDATGPLTADGSLLYRLDFAYLNKGSYRDFMGKERKFIAPSLTWKPTEALEFNLNVEYRDDDTVFDPGIPVVSGVNGAKGHLANVPRNRSYIVPGSTESFKGPLVEFNWSYNFNDDWKIRNGITATFVDNKYIETFPLGVGNNDSLPLFLSTGNSIRDNYTAYLDLNGHFETKGVKHNILVGVDTYYERTTFDQFDVFDLQIDNIFNPVYPQVDVASLRRTPHNDVQDGRSEWYGVYFQDQLTLFDKLHLLLGGRYNWANISSGSAFGDGVSLNDITLDTLRAEKFTPRAGIVYQVAPWLSLYGNYVESFGGNNGRSGNGQPFAPQIATQYEGGIKTEFFGGKLTGNLAYYHITKENILTRDPDSIDPRVQRAIGEARSQGIEFDLNGKLNDQISLIATYAFNDARITKDFSNNLGNRLRFTPEHSASFWVKYEPIERFSLGTGVYLAGKRQGNTANTFSLPGYARWDAMAAYRFDVGESHLTAQVNVNNILNKNYFHGDVFEIGGLPAEPLTVLGSLRLEY